MHVVETGHDNALILPRKSDRSVDQNLEPSLLERFSHIGRIMVPKNCQPAVIHSDPLEQLDERRDGSIDWCTVVPMYVAGERQ
jgi:hypothetical protein